MPYQTIELEIADGVAELRARYAEENAGVAPVDYAPATAPSRAG